GPRRRRARMTDPSSLALTGTLVIVGSGLLALLLARAPRIGSLLAAGGALAGGCLGLWASIAALAGDFRGQWVAPWHLPGGTFIVGLDPLSAFLLVPVFALGALCAVYGRGYLGRRAVAAAELNLLLGAMVLVLVARQALLFVVAWEAMTLLAYLLVSL